MGILRSDRVSGLGGANAVNGSVSFAHDGDTGAGESGALQVQNENDALTFGTGDFTVELWFYSNRVGVVQSLYDGRGTGSGANTAVYIRLSDANKIQFFTTNAFRITGSTTIAANTWYHVALTRTGSTHTLYVNGSSDGTWSGSSLTYTGPTNTFSSIGSDDNGAGAYGLNGYISNVRVAKELIYSAAFTAPTTRLSATTDTTLICCQSPGNVLASYGGLNLNAYASDVNSKAPSASRFVPDKGEDYGTTFVDNTKFDTLSYMVPPGGTTTESNRGRAVMAGGETPSNTTNIQYVQMQSDGNATQFGSLTTASRKQFSCASSTRGIFGSGYAPSATNVIEYVTIATTSNVTNFGDIQQDGQCQGCSNNTRGIVAGGYGNPGDNIISYLTIATTGDSTDFGDLATGRYDIACLASSTRGLLPGGNVGAAANNTISYVTIASTGNDTDFGDSTSAFSGGSGVASSTRGGFALCTSQVNTIDYVTIASAGNAADFGDLIDGRSEIMNGGASNSIRGLFCGGQSPTIVNTIDYITIASTGNAKDFGDMNVTASATAAASDSHGGIS